MKLLRPFAAALIALTAIGLMGLPSAQAAERPAKDRTVIVRHGPITPAGVQGKGLGAVRFFTIQASVDGKPGVPAYLTGTLTTIGLVAEANRDIRAANLTVVVGGEQNQLVIGGISIYPADGSTLAPGTKTARPILGGSGIYNAARGYVVSTNLGADGWTHVFHISAP